MASLRDEAISLLTKTISQNNARIAELDAQNEEFKKHLEVIQNSGKSKNITNMVNAALPPAANMPPPAKVQNKGISANSFPVPPSSLPPSSPAPSNQFPSIPKVVGIPAMPKAPVSAPVPVVAAPAASIQENKRGPKPKQYYMESLSIALISGKKETVLEAYNSLPEKRREGIWQEWSTSLDAMDTSRLSKLFG